MSSIGALLRAERERQGFSLEAIAQQTRIRRQYLESLEKNDFGGLPGRFFARSFANQYADFLGINTPELQAALQAHVAPPPPILGNESTPDPELVSWAARSEFTVDPLPNGTASAMNTRKLVASFVMLLATVIAAASVFWLWQRTNLQPTEANNSVIASPETASTAKAEPPPLVPETVSPPAAQPTNVEAKIDPAQTSTPPNVDQAVSPTASTATVANSSEPPLDGRIQLSVAATEDVWVRITVDGKVRFERVLAKGEVTRQAGNESARMLVGNAGGLDIRYNGSAIGQVGPRGHVRTIEFGPDAFRVIEPQKKPPSPTESQPQPVAGL